MRTRVILTGSVAVVCLCSLIASAQSSQDKANPPIASASPERMTGLWRFNKELSTVMPEPESPPDAGGGGRRGPGGGRPGGGGGRGGRGGAGGFGRANGGGGGRNGGGVSAEDMLKVRALSRDLADVAATLTIVVAPSHVTITNDRGTSRKFTTDEAAQEIDLGNAKVTVKTKWDEDILTQEWTAGKAKLGESYQVTVQGHMLVVRIGPVVSGRAQGSPATPTKYVFDRVE